MGLCDASVVLAAPGESTTDYVLVWVRENPDPAYLIAPVGMQWRITDNLRQHVLSQQESFEAALQFIRPVLSSSVAAA